MKKTLIASIVMSALAVTILTGCNNSSEPNVINESNLINQTIDVVSNTEPELIPIEATVTTPAEITVPEASTAEVNTTAPEEITTTEETAPQTVTEATTPQTWNETPMDKQTMYVSQGGIYSRIKAIQGSKKISQYNLNDEVQVVARTDTDYYKLSDGNFIHVSFLSNEITVITTTAATTPAPAQTEEDMSVFATLAAVPDPEYLATFTQKLFDLTNQERAKYGLPALKQRDDLTAIAMQRAKDLSEWYDPEHHRPNGEKWYEMLYRQDMYYGHMGENIAAGQTSPEEMIEAWMNSPVHRKNILTDDFDFLGVGFYFVEYDDKQLYHYYWVQDFYGYYRES